jgi:hypothetical protein
MENGNTKSSETKPAKKKKPTKGESLAEITELLEQIEAKSAEIKIARAAFDDSKDAAKIKKGVWQTKLCELEDLADTRRRWAAEAKRQPLLHPQPGKAAKLPDGATATTTVGILRDIKQDNDLVLTGPGEKHTGYVDQDGDVFLMIAGKRIDLKPEDFTEIVEVQSERPLLDHAAPPSNGEWRKFTIDRLGGQVTAKDREKLAGANLLTLGDLQDRMQRDSSWWAKDIKGIGEAGKTRIEDEFNAIIASEAATS